MRKDEARKYNLENTVYICVWFETRTENKNVQNGSWILSWFEAVVMKLYSKLVKIMEQNKLMSIRKTCRKKNIPKICTKQLASQINVM